MRRTIAAYEGLRAHLLDIAPREWGYITIPYAILLTFLLSIGPHLQYYALSYLHKDAISIYDSAYKNGLAEFPSAAAWLAQALFSPFLIIGLLISVVSLRQKGMKDVIGNTAVSVFIAITFIDLVVAGFDGTLSANYLVKSVGSNFVGSCMVYVICAGSLFLYTGLFRTYYESWLRILAPISLVSSSFLLSLGAYCIFYFFYQPSQVRFRLVAESPFSGWVGPKEDGAHRFSFVPHDAIGTGVHLTSPRGVLEAKWRRASSVRHHLKVSFYSDCPDPNLSDLRGAPALTIDDIRTLNVRVGTGYSVFKIQEKEGNSYRFNIDDITSYWITRDEKSGINIEKFVSPADSLSVTSGDGVSFYIATALTQSVNHVPKLVARTVEIQVNGQKYHMRIDPPELLRNGQLRCRSATVKRDGLEIATEGALMFSGVLLDLKPSQEPLSLLSSFDESLHVSGANGWVKFDAIPLEKVNGTELGRARLLIANGKTTSLVVDDRVLEPRPHETVQIIGNIEGKFLDDGAGHFSGEARAIWRGDSRLNPTRWERLATEYQIAFLTLIGAVIAWLVRLLPTWIGRIRRNEEIPV